MNTGNSKTNEQHKFVLNLSQKLDLRFKTYLFIHKEKYKTAVRKQ